MAWDFSTEPEFEAQLEWMRGFVRDEIIPLETLELSPSQLDAALGPLKAEVKGRGLWAAHLPPELGGGGFGQVKLGLMHEILGQCALAPVVFGNNAPDSGNAELLAVGIESSGREEQRRRWLEPLLAGELRSAFSMTEPGAGADPTLIRTTAVRDGDEWVINGHKWFTSNGSVADFLIVMAVTNPDVHPYQGTSMIIVPAGTPGVEVVRDVATMENPVESFGRFGGHAEIYYRDVRVPYENLVGREGEGFVLAQKRLGPGRIHHCMRLIGSAERALELLCRRAASRVAWGRPLADQGVVQDWIAEARVRIEQARLLVLKTAWLMDTVGNKGAHTEIQAIKVAVPAMAEWVIDKAIQVHGAAGISQDFPLAQLWASARSLRFADGPDEVHKRSLARRELRKSAEAGKM